MEFYINVALGLNLVRRYEALATMGSLQIKGPFG